MAGAVQACSFIILKICTRLTFKQGCSYYQEHTNYDHNDPHSSYNYGNRGIFFDL